MSRSYAFFGGVLLVACATASAVACVSEQDLGSHAPFEGGVADGSPSAEDGAAPGTVDSGHEGKILFVTDGRYIGDLRTEGGAASGPAGGDAICMQEAKAAGIGGVFKAWLSTSTENAKDRIAPVGPWRMVEGTVIFPGRAVVGFPLRYPRFTAMGVELFASNDPAVWTGTNGDGVLESATSTCKDWTSGAAEDVGLYGIVVATNSDWTDYGIPSRPSPCSARLRLYCFEQ